MKIHTIFTHVLDFKVNFGIPKRYFGNKEVLNFGIPKRYFGNKEVLNFGIPKQ